MIKDGVLLDPDVDMIFGFHNCPGLPIGTIATRFGPVLAGSGRFEIQAQGTAGHSSSAEYHMNPISLVAHIVIQLEQWKQKIDQSKAVINLLSIHGGDPKRGIASEADLMGVYYFETHEELERIKVAMTRLIQEVTQKQGGVARIEFRPFHPPTINAKPQTTIVLDAAHALFGQERVKKLLRCMMVAEDFSEYLQRIPGCFFLVGAGRSSPAVHTASYDFNDDVILPAAAVFCKAVISTLS